MFIPGFIPVNKVVGGVSEIDWFFQCDPYYIVFTVKNGFKIRLSLKKNTTFVERFVECVGKKENIDKTCLQYIDLIEVKMQQTLLGTRNILIK